MDSDQKLDMFGCVTLLITSCVSLIIGVLLAAKWSADRAMFQKILIWAACLFGSGVVGYHAMLAITLPFAHYADKKAKRQGKETPNQ